MLLTRKMTIGSGRPTGPTMPEGRWAGLGRACAPAHAPSLQPLLSLHQQFDGSRGFDPGSFSADLPHAGELSHRLWRLPNLADQRHAQSAGGSLPQVAPRPNDRRARRRAAGGARIERASAVGIGQTFAGIARGDYSAGLAGFGIHGNSAGAFGAGRYGKIANQPRTHRTGTHSARNGSGAIVGFGRGK